jgi:type 1 glutamine amidotransferase
LPPDIAVWCDRIATEEGTPYPVDQSDGGEDDDLNEHVQWHASLASVGRNPKSPWLRQTPAIRMDDQVDFVSDSGNEIWNILADKKIDHVMLCGVHTNMCVLGRPFGLRQLNAHGKQAVLVRDLTDTMYNPLQWPYVNHFSGTDRVIDYVERTVCATMTSDQVLGGAPFRFRLDTRPHWVVMIAEDEYKTEQTLTEWAQVHLARDFRVSIVYGDGKNPGIVPGLEVLDDADGLLVSVRRKPMRGTDLDRVRAFVASGRPVLGIRTASHAFCLREGAPGPELQEWPEFDAQVFGGNYTGHHPNDWITGVSVAPGEYPSESSIVQGTGPLVTPSVYRSHGSLYRVRPLRPGTRVLLEGTVRDATSEPTAWTYIREDAGKSFYTSLGHVSDFEEDAFRALLLNAAYWLMDQPKRVSPGEIQSQRQAWHAGQGKQR